MGSKEDEIQQEIAVIRNKKIDHDHDMLDFDAICAVSGISHDRGFKIAVAMMVEKYRKITSRDLESISYEITLID